jgi:sugar phosphate isomerase/epimerase
METMKLAICNELFENWPWEKICDVVRSAGYEGIEVAPFTLAGRAEEITPLRRTQLRSAAESRGIEIIGLHWLLVKPPGLYITHPDAAIREATARYFTELVRLCADLGGAVMVIGSPKQRSLLPGVDREQAMGYASEVFTPSLETAAARGVTLAIEPLSTQETDFLSSAAEAVELIERIGHPNFRLQLDVKAMSRSSGNRQNTWPTSTSTTPTCSDRAWGKSATNRSSPPWPRPDTTDGSPSRPSISATGRRRSPGRARSI